MLSGLDRRAMIGNNENPFGDEFEEIGFLLREQRRQEADDLEKELNLYRSGSAPPIVDGSPSAIGGNGFISEEELSSDPAYLSYYSNVNLNPRLPLPLLSREDCRFAQRLQVGSSAIGDRRKVNRDDVGYGFNLKKEESDGLIGLPGLGLGSKQKSLAERFTVRSLLYGALYDRAVSFL